MTCRILIFVSAFVILAFSAPASYGLVWVSSPDVIYSYGGLDVEIPGSEYDLFNTLTDPFGETIQFDSDLEHLVSGSGWDEWHGELGVHVGFAKLQSSIRMDFSRPVWGFGMWIEPNTNSYIDFEVGTSDGEIYAVKGVDWIDGYFLGFTYGEVDWIQITPGFNAHGFSMGEFVVTHDPVPEPSTLALLGLGLLGAGAVRKLRKKV